MKMFGTGMFIQVLAVVIFAVLKNNGVSPVIANIVFGILMVVVAFFLFYPFYQTWVDSKNSAEKHKEDFRRMRQRDEEVVSQIAALKREGRFEEADHLAVTYINELTTNVK